MHKAGVPKSESSKPSEPGLKGEVCSVAAALQNATCSHNEVPTVSLQQRPSLSKHNQQQPLPLMLQGTSLAAVLIEASVIQQLRN